MKINLIIYFILSFLFLLDLGLTILLLWTTQKKDGSPDVSAERNFIVRWLWKRIGICKGFILYSTLIYIPLIFLLSIDIVPDIIVGAWMGMSFVVCQNNYDTYCEEISVDL